MSGVPGSLVQVRQTTKQVVVQRRGLTSDSQTARFSSGISVVLRLHVWQKTKFVNTCVEFNFSR